MKEAPRSRSVAPALDLASLLFPHRDETFARLVDRLSEPTRAPHGDNFLSNEDSYPRVAAELAARSAPVDVYLGVGPDQNFTLLAHARPSLALIVDYRRRNLLVHALHRALFQLGPTRVSYLQRLMARSPATLSPDPTATELVVHFSAASFEADRLRQCVDDVARVLKPAGVLREDEWPELATIQSRLAGPGMMARFLALNLYPTFSRLITTTDRQGAPAHLLASEPLYQVVRGLQMTDRIIPIVADFAGDVALPRIADWLRSRGLRVGVLYISDVEFFLLRGGRWNSYVANLARLPWREGAVIVRTSTRQIDHPARVQGDSSTTLVLDARRFLDDARAGRIRTVDDLFPVL
ncbi:MAG: hypothetical protein U0794_14245 [Isosphaeraceae bacterium]